jgi:tRNA G18 (ribose-2'-O)-methylase SpoU
MSAIPIDTVEDARLTVYRDLKSPLSKRRGEFFVVESFLLVQRLLSSGFFVVSVLAEERFVDTVLPLVSEATPVYVIPHPLVHELTGFRFHRGVLACARRPANPDLQRLVPHSPIGQLLTVCVGIRDPENLGGVIRSSAAFGCAAILLGPDCADPFSRRVARTSMGANFHIPIVQSNDLASDLTCLRDRFGVRLIATVLDDGARPLPQVVAQGKLALLFGSEGYGLEPCWVRLCDTRVTIPMQKGIDSLNVSVAAGIILHHFAAVNQQTNDGD